MGGAGFEIGNVTPAAEFNIHVDPHAAAIVLDSGIPITMIPLDVTHQVLSTPPRIAALRALGNRCGPAVAALLAGFEATRTGKFGDARHGVARSVRHRLSAAPGFVRGPRGQCRDRDRKPADHRDDGRRLVGRHRPAGQCAVSDEVDADGFYSLLTDRLARLP